MCGICGKLIFDRSAKVAPSLLKAMADTMVHRGPDDEGYYASGSVGLGFRRLAIIDLNTGHQPISNEDGTVWIVFNGEIYNYVELRRYLEAKGHVFRTQTDTEVIVHLYEELGENCVERLRGMFAFAIWDEREQSIFLARDRVGIKPLYYWLTDRALIFGSEIKAILADPEVEPEVIPEMVGRFLTNYFVPGQETLLRNIRKLSPGYCMLVKAGTVRIRQYWDLRFEIRKRSLREAEEELVELLDESVRLHMISDVPVGFLLSGGVDSTAMLAFAAGKSKFPLHSFTLGFDAPGIVDERPYARLAARHFGAEHHEMTITAQEFGDFLPRYVWHMEEPVCEPPAVALYYVSSLAKDYVKVLISGEGGDEAFAGYQNYRSLLWLERLKAVLGPLNSGASWALMTTNRLLRSDRVARYAPILTRQFPSYYYSRISGPLNHFSAQGDTLYSDEFSRAVKNQAEADGLDAHLGNGSGNHLLNRMLYIDTKTWLPDDLLLKADKMTMANSIELRVPLLDHLVLEFAASLPEDLKVRRFTTKYIAKKTLRARVPNEILGRRKAGFPVPVGSWLAHDLEDMVRDVLLDRETISRGYFDRGSVSDLVDQHCASGCFTKEIFSLLALELWHRTFVMKPAAAETSKV